MTTWIEVRVHWPGMDSSMGFGDDQERAFKYAREMLEHEDVDWVEVKARFHKEQ